MKLIYLIVLPACLILNILYVPELSAQFNGDFEIKRYYLSEENFYDWKAYQIPVNWEKKWLASKNAMRISTGSISMEEFYISHEIKLQADLTNDISFLYHQQQDSLYRPESDYKEAEFRFGDTIHYSIIGFPSYDKKYGSAGYAIAIGEAENFNFARFSRLNQFLEYNEKNVDNDRTSENNRYEKLPIVYRFQTNYLLFKSLLINMDLKEETETVFMDYDQNQKHVYRGSEVNLHLGWWPEFERIIGLKLYHEHEKRNIIPNSGSDISNADQLLVLSYLDFYTGFPIFEGDFLSIGFLKSQFTNKINDTDNEPTYDFLLSSEQVYSKWQIHYSDLSKMLLGFQGGTYKIFKEKENEIDKDAEGNRLKGTVGYILRDPEKYAVVINTTWDLNYFPAREWDGGNVIVVIYF